MQTHLLALIAILALMPLFRASAATISPNSVRPVPTNNIARTNLTFAETSATMTVEIPLPIRNFPALQARIAAGGQIAAADLQNYLPTAADYNAVSAAVTALGLTVGKSDPYRLAVFATGTVSQIQKAFNLAFARVTDPDGVEFTSATNTPTLPPAIASRAIGINGLQPHSHPRHHFHSSAVTRNSTTSPTSAPYLPSAILKAYGAPSTTTGSGQTIAIVIDTLPLKSDLTTYWSTVGSPQTLANISFIQVVPGTLAAPGGEETLDTEWTSTIAPSSKIRVYAALDLGYAHLDQAYQQVLADAQADPTIRTLSLSYGGTEASTPTAQMQTDDQYMALLAAQGISVFVAAGDGGSNPSNTTGFYLAFDPLSVEFPASDPNVTAVGGTSLTLTSAGAIATEKVWNGIYGSLVGNATGGGISAQFPRPSWQTATGYPAFRLVPDIAAPADPIYGGLIILNGKQQTVGGTSWGAPTWAGFTARINQARAAQSLPSLGLLAAKLYSLQQSVVFNDIVTGSNGKYSAGPGFDLCTGLGTPNLPGLFAALASGAVGSVTVYPPQTVAVSAGATQTLSISPVVGATYSWTLNGTAIAGATGSSLTLSDTSVLAAGSYAVTAKVNGSAVASEAFTVSVNSMAFFTESSTLANITASSPTVITGFTVQGTTAATILIRAIGPSLAQFGGSTSGNLANPTLTIVDSSGATIATNAGWGNNPLVAAAEGVLSIAALPAGSSDAALVLTLAPGNYRADVSSLNNSTGTVLLDASLVP